MALVRIDPTSDLAPYEQVRTQLAGLVVSGQLEPGEKLPTVRQLAGELGLAANTVARAFRELEADGVIATRGRKGSFVSGRVLEGGADLAAAVATFTDLARTRGASLAEAKAMVEAAWPRP